MAASWSLMSETTCLTGISVEPWGINASLIPCSINQRVMPRSMVYKRSIIPVSMAISRRSFSLKIWNYPDWRMRSACSFQTVTKGGSSLLAKSCQLQGKFSMGFHNIKFHLYTDPIITSCKTIANAIGLVCITKALLSPSPNYCLPLKHFKDGNHTPEGEYLKTR
jgi:hypothetical protein